MSSYNSLKATINANIKQNNNQEITGVILNSVLNSMVESLGAAFQFKGVLLPSTNPGTPDEKVAYIGAPGTYTYINSTIVPPGYLGVFTYGSAWSVSLVQVGKDYDEVIDQLSEDVVALKEEVFGTTEPEIITILGSSLSSCGGSIRNSDNKWVQITGYYGAIVPVDAYRGKNLKIYVNSQRGSSYAFVKAAPVWNSAVQYATGYSAVQYTTTDISLTIPEDALYLYVYMNSNGTIYTPDKVEITIDRNINGLVDRVGKLETAETGIQATILGTSLSSCGGTIASATNSWQQDANYYGAIIPMDDYQGGRLRLYPNSNGNPLNYAFVKASPTWGAAVQYATGYSKVLASMDALDLDIPGDAVFLYVYMSSNGTIFTPDKVEIYDVGSVGDKVILLGREEDLQAGFLRVLAPQPIRAAIYNIGHFSGGVNKNSSITAADYEEKLAAYKAVIKSISPDVLGFAEYSRIFGKNTDNVNVKTKDVLLGGFLGYEGLQYNYSCDALFFKTIVEGIKSKDYVCNQSAVITHTTLIKATDYYYIDSDLFMRGERVKLVSTHLAFDNNNTQVCANQIAELISLYAGYDKVIFLGDWNVATFSMFDPFVTAGYTLANDGSFITYPVGAGRALDNIIVKGLTISNPGMIETTSLSDHYPFYCDISL